MELQQSYKVLPPEGNKKNLGTNFKKLLHKKKHFQA